MLNVALRDAKPAVIVCPNCARHLMEVKDVQWATSKLTFTFVCTGCSTELERTIAGDEQIAAYTSRASVLLRELEIFKLSA